ncbi:MAG: ABC transporter permease subunit [Caldicoprobacterales bacterium]|jgi:ABC-type transport system involved in cytochrome c biogenesis permease component|nr:ABC transporter permease [Clostridiales bacterium]
MKTTVKLLLGELKRLIRYKILPVSLVTALLWFALFLFLSREESFFIAPLLIYVDSTIMVILLVGAFNHLERQDGTISTMMVLPVSIGSILTAKAAASMMLALSSMVVTAAALYFIHNLVFDYAALFLFILLTGVSHGAIGFFLALNTRNFSSMLGLLMAYIVVFTLPTILFTFGILDARYDKLLMISPSHSAETLIRSAVTGMYNAGIILAACAWLLGLTFVLYRFAIYPKFKRCGVRG